MIIDSPRPISGSALVSAGVTGIIRYLPKQHGSTVVVGVTASEVADLNAHGVQLALVYEDSSATWMGGGAAAGTQAAQWVQSQLNSIGLPSAPVYFAADSNTLDSNAVNACLDAIAAVLGHGRTGEYGFAPQLTSGHAGNHAQRYWLCGSASGVQSWMALYQRNDVSPTVAGQSVDEDVAEQADWGQVTSGSFLMALTDQQQTDLYNWAQYLPFIYQQFAGDGSDAKTPGHIPNPGEFPGWLSEVPGSTAKLTLVNFVRAVDARTYQDATVVQPAEQSALAGIQSAESAANASAGAAVAALKAELDGLVAAVGKLPTSIPGMTDTQVQAVESAVSAAVVTAIQSNTAASPAQIAQAVLEALGAVLPKAA